jgi:hypothetical protein
LNNILKDLWDDCSEPAKDIYRYLCEHGALNLDTIGREEKTLLAQTGLAKISGNKASRGCRLLESFIKGQNDGSGSLVRLFGPQEEYRKNIRGLLELRLAQIGKIDSSLKKFLQRGIEDIPDDPDVCMANIRGIVDRALDIIWDAELGNDREIPDDWFQEWQINGEKGPENYWDKKFPKARRGWQIRLLHLLTGTDKSDPKANHISKSTYTLVNSLHGFGDYGQHLDGKKVPEGVAIAAIASSLELAENIGHEIK